MSSSENGEMMNDLTVRSPTPRTETIQSETNITSTITTTEEVSARTVVISEQESLLTKEGDIKEKAFEYLSKLDPNNVLEVSITVVAIQKVTANENTERKSLTLITNNTEEGNGHGIKEVSSIVNEQKDVIVTKVRTDALGSSKVA